MTRQAISYALTTTEPLTHAAHDARRLRVGVLAESVDLPAWQCALIERLQESDYLELCVVVLTADGPGAWDPAADPPVDGQRRPGTSRRVVERVYRLLEHRFALEADASAMRDGVPLLARARTMRAVPTLQDGVYRWSGGERARLDAFDLDVLVCLTRPELGASLATAARHGVWSVQHGDERSGYGNPAAFWEVYYGSPVLASSLRVVSARYEIPTVAYRSFSATDMTSVRRSRNNLQWKAASLLPRKLEELQRTGADAFFHRIDADLLNCSGPAVRRDHATDAQLAAHVAKIVSRGVRNRIRHRLYSEQWVLLFHVGDRMSTRLQDFELIVPPKECFWADPHVVFHGGRHYVFFEELPFATNRGHVCVLEIGADGVPGPARKVLERPYHLSYPLVYDHDGELLMIPESGESGAIEVYRCTRVPDRWEHVGNLMEGICAVDSTLLHHGGRWWLFANVVENEGASSWDQLFLFHSDALLGGRWIPHPLNPIVSDVRRARPAGPIFERDGKLYRPSQDCSVRYGYGIRIHQITKLTVDDYAELEVEAIWPDWDKSLIATHTLSYAHGVTVADALRPRRRF